MSVLALLAVGLACSPQPPPTRASFTVDGMTCGSCSSAITTALSEMNGVTRASADHEAGTAEAVITSSEVSVQQLAAEIESLGFTVTGTTTEPVDG
ncbi:MAG: heavy-metal-associated domain-containing protein [Thermoanaerobaculales bacterium]|jgi:copper chaperone CopZ|nr:heavy-metal-associated domain-containing protein [Thermoanaerobaculales bacterium]